MGMVTAWGVCSHKLPLCSSRACVCALVCVCVCVCVHSHSHTGMCEQAEMGVVLSLVVVTKKYRLHSVYYVS